MERVYNCIENLEFLKNSAQNSEPREEEKQLSEDIKKAKKRFLDAMDDDLNTADAISAIFDIVSSANKNISDDGKNSLSVISETLSAIHELGDVLGLFRREEKSASKEIEELIKKRDEARKAKNYQEADRIRDELKARNIELKDTPTGVKWSYIK